MGHYNVHPLGPQRSSFRIKSSRSMTNLFFEWICSFILFWILDTSKYNISRRKIMSNSIMGLKTDERNTVLTYENRCILQVLMQHILAYSRSPRGPNAFHMETVRPRFDTSNSQAMTIHVTRVVESVERGTCKNDQPFVELSTCHRSWVWRVDAWWNRFHTKCIGTPARTWVGKYVMHQYPEKLQPLSRVTIKLYVE